MLSQPGANSLKLNYLKTQRKCAVDLAAITYR